MKRNVKIILILCIFLFGAFLRLYKLESIPQGLYQDETAIGYNAYSILKTGKDEFGRSYPVYFESFGDFKLPVYIYATVISEHFFGLTPFAVRFPSAFFGILTLGIFYFYVYEIVKNERIALFSLFLLAINPWHIHYSRATFEVSIVLFLLSLGILLFLFAIKSKKHGFLFLSSITFILALYSYNLTRLLSPVLFITLVLTHWNELKKKVQFELPLTFIIGVFLLLPFIATIKSPGGFGSASGTLISSSATILAQIREFRSYIAQTYPKFGIVFPVPVLIGMQYAKNIAAYGSIPFYFLTGENHGNHGIGIVGQFHLFELITMAIGLFILYTMNKQGKILLISPIIITILIAALTRESPQATRSYTLLLSLPIISALGLSKIYEFAERQSISKILGLVSISCVIGYSFVYFLVAYFIRFPVAYAESWRSADKTVSAAILRDNSKYTRILIDKDAGFIYTSLLFYLQYPPDLFIATAQRTDPDSEGFREMLSFGKYQWKSIDWQNDLKVPGTLIITNTKLKPEKVPPKEAFYYPRRPVVIAVKQMIYSYPVEDIAYITVSSE